MTYPKQSDLSKTPDNWIGNAPKSWTIRRADFMVKSHRIQLNPESFSDQEVYHYSIPVVQKTSEGMIELGDDLDSAKILISETQLLVSKLNPRKGTVCLAHPHEELLTLASSEFVPILSSSVDIKYAYYVWSSDKVRDRLASFVQSVTKSHQRCLPSDILKLPWAWPSEAEQALITNFLDQKTAEIDALIEKKEALLKLLAEKRSAIITQAVTKGLNSHAQLKDTGVDWLGHIPSSWAVQPVKHNAAINPENLSEKTDLDFEFDYLDISNVSLLDGVKSTERLFFENAPSRARRIVRGGDVLVSTVRTYLKAVCHISFPFSGNLVASTGFALLRSTSLDQGYLGWVCRSEYFVSKVVSVSKGVSYPATNAADIGSILIPIPPYEEQRLISEYLSVNTQELDIISNKVGEVIDMLREYRSSLITAAVTGQIEVAV